MRTFRIDFTQDNPCLDGCYLGRIGEHNATELIITPPAAMTENEAVTSYVIAFVTGNMLIHSEPFEKAETVRVKIWRQLTQNPALGIQLEAYDSEGEYIAKSQFVNSLKLLPSADGENCDLNTDNPDIISAVTANTKARHIHENASIIDSFDVNYAKTRPTFNGDTLATQGDVTTRVAEHKQEVLNLLSSVPKFAVAVVDELPAENISNTTIYLIRELETENNLYTEYIYINDAWECLGSQSVDADLSNYAKIDDVPNNKELLERFSETLGDFYGVSYNGVQLVNIYHLLEYATKKELNNAISNIGGSGSTERPTAEYVYNFLEDYRLMFTYGDVVVLTIMSEETTDDENAIVGKEIVDIEFQRSSGDWVSVNTAWLVDSYPCIPMLKKVIKADVNDTESVVFASLYCPTANWIRAELENGNIKQMRITYYTD